MDQSKDAPATNSPVPDAPGIPPTNPTPVAAEPTATPPQTTADRMMAEARTVPPESIPSVVVPVSHEEALRKCQEAFGTAEAGLVSGYASIENGSHDDMASCRGTLSTLLAQLRNAWPGGKTS